MSTHSACRGELFRRSLPKSLYSSARSDCRTNAQTSVKKIRFIPVKDFSQPSHKATARQPSNAFGVGVTRLSGGCRRGFVFREHCINAPASGPVEKDEKKERATKPRELAFVRDPKARRRRMHHKIGHS